MLSSPLLLINFTWILLNSIDLSTIGSCSFGNAIFLYNFFKKGFYLNKSESLNTEHLVQDFQAFSSIFGCEIIHDANRRKKYKFKIYNLKILKYR